MNKYTAFLDNPTLVARFWNRVDKTSSPFGCWLWTGARTSQGSGYLRLSDGASLLAHRVVYELTFRRTGEYRFRVYRACGNLLCVNPDHMRFPGPSDARRVDPSAQRILVDGRRTLTEDNVREIRSLVGKVRQIDLAARFGVTQSAISGVVRRVTWRHIP